MSGPAPEMSPAEPSTGIPPSENGETADAAAVSTDPASTSSTAIISSGGPQSNITAEGEIGDSGLSTPPLVSSPLPLENQQHLAADPMPSSESPQPLEDSSSATKDDSRAPLQGQLKSVLTNDTAPVVDAMQQVSPGPAGGDETLQEAGNNDATAAASEATDVDSAFEGEPTVSNQPSTKIPSIAEAEGACTSGAEGTRAPADSEVTANFAADNAGQTATEAVVSVALLTAMDDPVNDDSQVGVRRQSNDTPNETGGGEENLSVEVAQGEDVNNGSSVSSPVLEGTAPTTVDKNEEGTTTALSFDGGGSETQSCGSGRDEGGGASLPPSDRAEEDHSRSTPTEQPHDDVQDDGQNKSTNVGSDDPHDTVSGREADTGPEVASSADSVHQAASETKNDSRLGSQPQHAESTDKEITRLEAAEQNNGARDDDDRAPESPPSFAVLGLEADVEDGDSNKTAGEDDAAEKAPASTGKTSMPEGSTPGATPTTTAGETGDLLVAEGVLLAPPLAGDVAGDSINADEAGLDDAPTGDSVAANLEEGRAGSVNIATEGASAETSAMLVGGAPPHGPVSRGTSLDNASALQDTLQSGGDVSQAGKDPRDVNAAQGQAVGSGEETVSPISVDATLHAPSARAGDTTVAPDPQDMPPSGTDQGDDNGDSGHAAVDAAAEAVAHPKSGAVEAETTPPITRDEEDSHSQVLIAAGARDASTAVEVASTVGVSGSVVRVVVQGGEGDPTSHEVEAGAGVPSAENVALLQGGDCAVVRIEEGVVPDAGEAAGTGGSHAEVTASVSIAEAGADIKNANSLDRREGEHRRSETFDDLSSNVGEAPEGEGAKSEGGTFSTSLEEGLDSGVSSLGGEILESKDGSGDGARKNAERAGNGGPQITAGDGLGNELLAPRNSPLPN